MPRIPLAIHVLERKVDGGNLTCIDSKKRLWQTGYWIISDNTADALVGANVFIHQGQRCASHMGGVIVDVFHEPDTDYRRKVIRFTAKRSAIGVSSTEGWGNERKIEWQDVPRIVVKNISISDKSAFAEGGRRFGLHARRERDSALIRKAKLLRLHRTGCLKCEVCGFDFAAKYGAHGKNFIEAHHKIPVAKLDGKVKTRIVDLALVCSNCHRMLHFGKSLQTVEGLKALLRRGRV